MAPTNSCERPGGEPSCMRTRHLAKANLVKEREHCTECDEVLSRYEQEKELPEGEPSEVRSLGKGLSEPEDTAGRTRQADARELSHHSGMFALDILMKVC